ncbi:type II toxin-antitoxin system VapC family toxin [Ottowia testudinis]|uniref:Ribonuclease VapC n=1 Tax=Ottowia testudinis TaxID=2816950 RepID=A0A975CHY9_9BURK|nr:PIN domain nuclease [Ottowia testudinis]QTD45924.1 PIN domain nuclease [Ottowia testudinis]
MLVVDSSVWIDFFRGAPTPAADELARHMDEDDADIIVPDLVLYEVLRGFRLERDYRNARQLLEGFTVEAAFSPELACQAAEHYRDMVSRGFTIRSALDVMIGAFCIERDYLLLHSDRDFDVMQNLRGLRVWSAPATGSTP